MSENNVIYNKDKSRLILYAAAKEEELFEVPDGVTSIAAHAFSSCKLKNIALPDSLTELGSGAFSCASNLETIKLPDGVIKIPSSLFSHCINLKSVVLSENTEEIGNCTFLCCYKLEGVNIPQNVREISNGLFNGCRSLRSVVLPKQIETICDEAFLGCNKLEKLYIRNDDIVFEDDRDNDGYELFDGCSHLTIYANETLRHIYLPMQREFLSGFLTVLFRSKSHAAITLRKHMETSLLP